MIIVQLFCCMWLLVPPIVQHVQSCHFNMRFLINLRYVIPLQHGMHCIVRRSRRASYPVRLEAESVYDVHALINMHTCYRNAIVQSCIRRIALDMTWPDVMWNLAMQSVQVIEQISANVETAHLHISAAPLYLQISTCKHASADWLLAHISWQLAACRRGNVERPHMSRWPCSGQELPYSYRANCTCSPTFQLTIWKKHVVTQACSNNTLYSVRSNWNQKRLKCVDVLPQKATGLHLSLDIHWQYCTLFLDHSTSWPS